MCGFYLPIKPFRTLQIALAVIIFFNYLFSDQVMIVTCVGLLVHLVVTYGTTNKPFNQVLKGLYSEL